MRYFSTIALLIISQFVMGQPKSPFSKKPFEISGKIDPYRPDSKNAYITFRVSDLSGRNKDTAIAINKDGSFGVTLYQVFSGDIAFLFNEEFVTMYASPGDKIYLSINPQQFADEKTRPSSIEISGESSAISKYIIRWNQARANWEPSVIADWSNKELSDETFANDRKKQLAEELVFLEKFSAKESASTEFTHWAKNSLLYSAGFDISFHCFAGKINDRLHDTTFMRMLEDIPLKNDTALHNSDYYRYVNMVSGDLQIIANINPAYATRKRNNGKNPVPIHFEMAEKYSSGLVKELFYYNMYFGIAPVFTDSYLTSFSGNVKDDILKAAFELKRNKMIQPFQPVDIISKIQQQKADTVTKGRILSVLEAETNRYVFIDFWGSWCAPCMLEMPHYPALIDSLKNLPVGFIFMSTETKEEKVNEIKKLFAGKARFINLTDNETRLLNNVFGFSSYPSHFLLGPGSRLLEMKVGSIASDSGVRKEVIQKLKESIK